MLSFLVLSALNSIKQHQRQDSEKERQHDILVCESDPAFKSQIKWDFTDQSKNADAAEVFLSVPCMRNRYPTLTVQALDYINWQSENDPSHTLPVMVKLDAAVDTKRLIQALKTAVEAHPGVDNCLKADPDGTVWQYPGTDLSGNYDPEIITVSGKELDDIRQTLSS